jgi:hypothetical protein
MIKLDGDKTKLKVLDEKDTRKKLMNYARQRGFEQDLIILLNKYDILMRNCTNEKERKDIGKLGSYEVFNLFNRGGDLYVDGHLVYSDPDKKENGR